MRKSVFALLIEIVGCASSGSRTAAAHLTDGVYEYSANIPGSQPGRTLWVRSWVLHDCRRLAVHTVGHQLHRDQTYDTA